MKFSKLQHLAHALGPPEEATPQIEATLRQFVADPRFAVIVRIIEDQKTLAADASCALKFAEHHGCLAHAAGVRYGLIELENRLRAACDPPRRRGAQAPPEV